MGIDLTQVSDLATDEFYEFLWDANRTTFDEPAPSAPVNFTVDLAEYVFGAAPQVLAVSWAVRETYTITSGGNGQHIATLEIVVPVAQALRISAVGVLFLRNDVTQEVAAAIRERVKTYDPTSGIDPLDWAYDGIPAGVKGAFSMFDFRLRSRTEKVGASREFADARNSALQHFQKFYGEAYRVNGPTTELIRDVPERTPHRNERKVTDATSDSEAAKEIDRIVREQNPGNCDGLEEWQERVADLANYSEYMTRWELVDIEICGIVFGKMHTNVLYTRNVVLQLWAFAQYPKDPLAVLGDMVKECAKQAATAGIVVGLVLGNFPAALAAFETAFSECMEHKLNKFVPCLIPGIAVMKVEGPWQK
jgi:hypothetical protein